MADLAAFVLARTVRAPVPLVPEIQLHQATELEALWHAAAELVKGYDDSPYWAFPWVGGQALARFVLDHPEEVRGQRVLDFASGSGLVAIAAARAGAARVVAADRDPFCEAAIPLNAALNGVTLEVLASDPVGRTLAGIDVVLAGDVFYAAALGGAGLEWLRGLAARGLRVLAGDPGRLYSPQSGTRDRGAYDVPASLEIESRGVLRTWVLEILP